MSPKPIVRVKRPAAAAVAAPEEEQVPVAVAEPEEEAAPVEVEQPTAEEDSASVYDEYTIDDLRAELANRKLDNTGPRSKLVARLEEDDAKPKAPAKPAVVVGKTTQTVPAKPGVPTTASKAAPAAPAKPVSVAPKAAPVPIPAKAEPAATADGGGNMVAATTFKEVFELLGDGMSLVIVKEGKNTFTMTLVDSSTVAKTKTMKEATSTGPKLKGEAYWKEVLSPEYYSWYYEDAGGTGKGWGTMTAEEKTALAEQLGATFELHADDRINVMRQTAAVLEKLGIDKWKEQYKDNKARELLKG